MRLFLFLNLFIFIWGCTTVEVTKGVIKVTDKVKNSVEEAFPKSKEIKTEKKESEEEEIKMRKSDPISYASNQMLKNKIMNEDEIKKINEKISIEMDEAMDFAINSPLNNQKEIFTDVYDESEPLPISVEERINLYQIPN